MNIEDILSLITVVIGNVVNFGSVTSLS